LQARLLGIKEIDEIVDKLNGIVEKRRGVPKKQNVEANRTRQD
jgi:hypothetical protein